MGYQWKKLTDVDESYENFLDSVLDRIIQHVPVITKIVPALQVVREPWYTKGLQKSAKQMLKLNKKTLKKRSEEFCQLYKQYRNLSNKLKVVVKQEYYLSSKWHFIHLIVIFLELSKQILSGWMLS